MSYRVNKIAKDLEEARARHDQSLAALKRPDGQPLFSPDEEARRRTEIQHAYEDAQADAQAALEQLIVDAEQQIAAVEHADPLARLLPTELEKASHMAAFVKEDYEYLSGPVLAQRARQALADGDKVLKALHLRYAQRTEVPELRAMIPDLEAAVLDVKQRDQAREVIAAAEALQRQMGTAGYLQRTYGSAAVPR